MKNVNCPVCIWEFLHYSSASLVPAAPSPWQLPAPCSACAHTSIKMHTHTHTHSQTHTHTKYTLAPFFRLCRRNGLDDWLTLWPLRPWCVSVKLSVGVCVYGSLIFERHRIRTHACCLSKGRELLVAEHTQFHNPTHIHKNLHFWICEDTHWHKAFPRPPPPPPPS